MNIILISIVGFAFGWFYSSWVRPVLKKEPDLVHPIEVHLGVIYCLSLMFIDLLFDKLTVMTGTINIILPFAVIALLRVILK